MSIPALVAPAPDDAWLDAEPDREWTSLDGDEKHERLLCAAGRVFARDGLDAPMPAVAAEAGAGVASVYRQFASKHELLAALVVRRMEQVTDAAWEAAERDADRWTALTEMLWTLVGRMTADDFIGQARVLVADQPDVAAASDRATEALERLMAGARAEGRLRADASTLDLRLLFAATRAAKEVEPDAWQRMLALLIDALDTQR
jgi:AcrR family transcriptional regulator